jgi:hypothetical protein
MLQMAGRMEVLGTETAFEVLARANALAAQGRSIINLGIGQPDFPTPAHIVEAGRKALADGHHGYTPANGIPALRAAVAADLWRRHKVEVSPDQVLVVPGGKVTMFFAIMMFGEPGAEILYPNPGFPIYESVIRFSGATPVPVPLYESADGGAGARARRAGTDRPRRSEAFRRHIRSIDRGAGSGERRGADDVRRRNAIECEADAKEVTRRPAEAGPHTI